jgi:Flp pilus assembly CpaE family ATPase
VLSRTDRRAEIGQEDVERTVGIDISHTIPSDYGVAVQAMNVGRPVVLDPQTGLAKSFATFAHALAHGPTPEKSPKTRHGSLFGRLSPRKA